MGAENHESRFHPGSSIRLGTDIQAFGPHLYADSTTSAALVVQQVGDRTVSALALQNASLTIDGAVGLALG
ncbi:hypothetical protein AXA44_36435 [Rhodococcus sp. SC4]|nr:hypothetical protein AXA44_36435 [Rhodococcus sp. SC4]